jgi:hypothetical protein
MDSNLTNLNQPINNFCINNNPSNFYPSFDDVETQLKNFNLYKQPSKNISESVHKIETVNSLFD